MAEIIAQKIIQAKRVSLERAKAKYNSYFLKSKFFESYKEEVHAILTKEDCEDVFSEM